MRVIYPGPQLAPLVGKYSIGGYVARLFAAGVEFIPMQRVTRIEPGAVHTADVYAGTPTVHADVDSVVLAFGGAAHRAPRRARRPRRRAPHPRRRLGAAAADDRHPPGLGAREETVIHHAGLRVSDAERASEFYCALGGERLTRPVLLEGRGAEQVVGVDGAPLRIAMIGFGPSALELFEVLDPAPDWARAPVVGTIPHVCLQVDDVDAALARAEELGGRRLWPKVDRLGATRAIYLTDPDGNDLELLDVPVSEIAAAFHKYFQEQDHERDRLLPRRRDRVRHGRIAALLPRPARPGGHLRRRHRRRPRAPHLGLRARQGRVVFLTVPGSDAVIEIFEFPDVERHSASSRPCDYGAGHFCLYTDDAVALHARAVEIGFRSRWGEVVRSRPAPARARRPST